MKAWLQQPAVSLRPFNRVAGVLFVIARPTEHLQIANNMLTAARKRHDVIKLELSTSTATCAFSFGARSNNLQFSRRNNTIIPLFARSTIAVSGSDIARIERQFFKQRLSRGRILSRLRRSYSRCFARLA